MTDARKDIAMIKIAIKQLDISDDDGNATAGILSTYRAMLKRLTGKTSVGKGAMTDAERQRVIKHLKSRGFKSGRRPRARVRHKFPDMASESQIAMVYGLWRELEDGGHLRSTGNAALNAWIEGFTPKFNDGVGLSAPEFLHASAAEKVIEALKSWLHRVRPKKERS